MGIPVPVRRALRPLVFAARRAAQRLEGWVRPPQRWDGRHDPVLERFEPWSGETDGRFEIDFLGVRTDPAFRPQIRAQPAGPLRASYPSPHYAYFELVFVLDSVLAAASASRYRLLELGAGYGYWLAVAAVAMRRSAARPVELVGVEMVPQHFEWMNQHLANNGIDPDAHTLIHGAVSDCDGVAVYTPEPDARLAYGQRMSRRRAGPAEPFAGSRDGSAPARVPCIDLRRLLAEQEPFDLIHVDVQGEELRALGHAWPELQTKARRLLVATHSRRIHRALRRRFAESGWRIVHDYRVRALERTPCGDVRFLDGMLACVRPDTE